LVKEISSERFEMNAENRRLLGLNTSGRDAPASPPAAGESVAPDDGAGTASG
jgi:hypothetical protein